MQKHVPSFFGEEEEEEVKAQKKRFSNNHDFISFLLPFVIICQQYKVIYLKCFHFQKECNSHPLFCKYMEREQGVMHTLVHLE